MENGMMVNFYDNGALLEGRAIMKLIKIISNLV